MPKQYNSMRRHRPGNLYPCNYTVRRAAHAEGDLQHATSVFEANGLGTSANPIVIVDDLDVTEIELSTALRFSGKYREQTRSRGASSASKRFELLQISFEELSSGIQKGESTKEYLEYLMREWTVIQRHLKFFMDGALWRLLDHLRNFQSCMIGYKKYKKVMLKLASDRGSVAKTNADANQ